MWHLCCDTDGIADLDSATTKHTQIMQTSSSEPTAKKGFLALPPELLERLAEMLAGVFAEDEEEDGPDNDLWGFPLRSSHLNARLLHPTYTPMLDVHLFDKFNVTLRKPTTIPPQLPEAPLPDVQPQLSAQVQKENEANARKNARTMEVASLVTSSRLSSYITRLWLSFDSTTYSDVQAEAHSDFEGRAMALSSAILHATANSITMLTIEVRQPRLAEGRECPQWQLDLPARFCSLDKLYIRGIALCTLAIMICERARPPTLLSWEPLYTPPFGALGATPAVPWPPQKYTIMDASGAQRGVSPIRSILPQTEFSIDRLSENDHLAFFAFIRPQPIHLMIRQMYRDWGKPLKDLVQMLRDSIDICRLTAVIFRDQADWYEANEEKSAIAREFRLALLEQWRGSGIKLVWIRETDGGERSQTVETVM